ncbi:MAG: zf-HC2 domain-containing protein [Vicinamibacterales bacterium]
MQSRIDHPIGCPDSGTLAAYADGRLGEAARRSLEEHLSGCDACLDVIADVMVMEVGWPTPQGVRRPLMGGRRALAWAAAAVLLAALALPSVRFVERFSRKTPSDVVLAESARSRWTGSHRSTGGESAESLTATGLHVRGILRAADGDWNGAVIALAAATQAQPDDARLQSDAAAAHLERAANAGQAADVVRAFGAAQRAVWLDPSLVEAWFNRALALERLELRSLARAAWADYLRVDSWSPWAAQARRHAEALAAPRSADRWPDLEAALRRRVDPALVEDAVRQHVSAARRFLETNLFPKWAAAATSEAGAVAVSARQDLRTVATAFARLTGDTLYEDTVDAIERAEREGPTAVRPLAAAHAGYARAAALLADDQIAAARPGMESAANALASAGSPYAVRARLDLAAIAYYTGHSASMASMLTPLQDEAVHRSYAFLESRSLWLLGLASFAAGQYVEAQGLWERMLTATERMGDGEGRAAAHGLLANLLDQLADDDDAWRHRLAYLHLLSEYPADRVRFGLLISAAGHALRNDAAAALPLQDAVIEEATRSARAAAVPEAYAQRASILAVLGRASEARDAMDAAWAALESVNDAALGARLERALLAAEARTLDSLDDPTAVQAAERAVTLANAAGDAARLPELYLFLGRAYLRVGRMQDAAVAAEAGLGVARTRTNAAAGVLEETRGLSAVAMRASLAAGDIAAAYRYGVHARARRPGFDDSREIADHRSVQRRLDDDEALLAINQLDNDVVAWLVTKSSVQYHIGGITRRLSARLVELQQTEIAIAAGHPRASATLYRELVRPFRQALTGIRRVVVAPDAPFYAASFPALFDRASGRFWVESVELTVGGWVADGPPSNGRRTFVDLPPDTPAVDAFALWREARPQSVVRINAHSVSNNGFPELSRLLLPGQPGASRSGVVFARDLPPLPPVQAVFLPDIDPGPRAASGAGSLDLAGELLDRGAAHVVTFLAPGTLSPDQSEALLASLTSGAPVPAAVAQFQRDVLRADPRPGPWSRLVVYGSGR